MGRLKVVVQEFEFAGDECKASFLRLAKYQFARVIIGQKQT